jgi:hypothetical protein
VGNVHVHILTSSVRFGLGFLWHIHQAAGSVLGAPEGIIHSGLLYGDGRGTERDGALYCICRARLLLRVIERHIIPW